MRYFVLATDYDGTLATDGHVHDATKDTLKRLRTSGRKSILVTGRELDDLQRTFPELDLFDYVVAENGAVLYSPAIKQEKLLVVCVINFGEYKKRTAKYAKGAKEEIREENTPKLLTQTTRYIAT